MDEIDIRFLINSPEVEQENSRVKAALSGTEKASVAAGKAMASAFEQGNIPLENMTENIRIQKQVLADLEKQHKAAEKKVDKMAPGAAKEAANAQLRTAKKEIEEERAALGALEAQQRQYEQSTVSLRTKIRKAKDEMAGMVEGTDEYKQKMQELGVLQDRFADISKQGQIFADDQKYIRATTETIQGISGAMAAGTGIATLFGASQENLAKIQARLQAVMAISIGVNQVAQVLNKDSYFTHLILARAKDQVTVATTRLSVALGISNVAAKALMATLTLGLSLAITGAIVLFNRMSKAKEEALKKDAALHDQVVKSRIEITQETAEIGRQFEALQKAEKGTKGYEKAKDKILSGYGKYLQGLSTEIRTLQDVEGAYKAISTAAIQSINDRARAAFVSDAQGTANEKMGGAMKGIRDNVTGFFSREYLDKFPLTITNIMAEVTDILLSAGKTGSEKMDAAMEALTKRGIGELDARRYLTGRMNVVDEMGGKNLVQDFHIALTELDSVEKVADRVFGKATPDKEAIAQNKAYWEQQRDGAQAALAAMENGKRGTAEWDEQLKKLRTAEQKLKTWDFATDPAKLQSKIGQAALQGEIELESARVAVMEDGRDKRLATAENEYRQRLASINKEQADLAAQYKAAGKKMSPEEKEAFGARRELAGVERDNKRYQAELEYFNQTEALYKELADVFLTEEQRKTKAIQDRFDELRNRVNTSAQRDGMSGGEAAVLYGQIDKAQQKAELDELREQFRSYEEQVAQIAATYNDKILKLRAAGYEAQAQEAERQRDKALKALSASMLQESDLWIRLFSEASLKSVAQIRSLLDETQKLYDFLQGKEGAAKPVGFTDEQLENLKKSPESLRAIQEAIQKLKQELGQKSPFERFSVDVKAGVDKISNAFKDGKGWEEVAGGVGIINTAFKEISPAIRKFGDDLGNIFGGDVSEAISQAMDLAESVGDVGAGLASIASGDIVGGVMNVVSGLGKIFSMGAEAEKRHQEALKTIAEARIQQQRQYNLLLLEQNLLYQEGKNAFGTDEIGRATNALRVYRQAIADYKAELQGDAPTKTFSGVTSGLYSKQLATYNQGIGALSSAQVVTGHKKTGLFGWGKGRDTYSSILAVYPKLIDSEGQLDVALAKSILSTQKMSDSTKNLVQSLIDLQEQAEAAREELNAYIQETYGDLGSGIMEALVGSIQSGTNAWEEFGKTGAKVLEKLGQQAAYSLFLQDDFNQLQKKLEAVYGSGLSEEQIARNAMDTVDQFYDQIGGKMQQAQDWLEYWQKRGQERGFDLWAEDESSKKTGASGQLQAEMTEGTASQLVGLWNMTALDMRALRELTAGGIETARQIQPDVRQILLTVILIEENTRATAQNTGATVSELKEGFDRMHRQLDAIMANTKESNSRR